MFKKIKDIIYIIRNTQEDMMNNFGYKKKNFMWTNNIGFNIDFAIVYGYPKKTLLILLRHAQKICNDYMEKIK